MDKPQGKCLLQGFSLADKTVARVAYYGLFMVALYELFQRSLPAAIAYLLFGAIGLGFLVLRILCAHCPYPAHKADCLIAPPKLIQKLAPYKGPHITASQKAGLILSLALLFALPHIWIWQSLFPGILFSFLSLIILLGAPIRYCQRCLHTACPFNRAAKI
ncbi:hypothetical protein [Dethiosulfatarculus sandiegensis]|uniref:DUF4395 domain-containing protein n=1 Tax=Dethiosulfatarculus sandiegensis TaxID=1429043 RepID=A0A0D2HQU6_9BACT|nr:hypothetical protein [Dethiosulfatarculus sandiegensis]KIX12848.1 hypothetical protein X474_17335 [Dethiosulfatarculus sandiegensis]